MPNRPQQSKPNGERQTTLLLSRDEKFARLDAIEPAVAGLTACMWRNVRDLLKRIHLYGFRDGCNAQCRTIADKLMISLSTLHRVKKAAIKTGLLRLEPTYNERGRGPNRWHVHWTVVDALARQSGYEESPSEQPERHGASAQLHSTEGRATAASTSSRPGSSTARAPATDPIASSFFVAEKSDTHPLQNDTHRRHFDTHQFQNDTHPIIGKEGRQIVSRESQERRSSEQVECQNRQALRALARASPPPESDDRVCAARGRPTTDEIRVFDVEAARRVAADITRIIGLEAAWAREGTGPAQRAKDGDLLAKCAILSQKHYSQEWLYRAARGVRLKRPRKTMAYLTACLAEAAGGKETFHRDLRRIQGPLRAPQKGENNEH